jgi:hypothetical protein
LRSLIPITEKPCSRVASWFSGEAVRIQVWGAAAVIARIVTGNKPVPYVWLYDNPQ